MANATFTAAAKHLIQSSPQSAEFLRIQFLEVAINPPLAEWNPAVGGEIGLDTRPLGDVIAQRNQSRNLPFKSLHAFWEGIAQALDNFEDREIDIAQSAADHISTAVVLEHTLEVTEEFRYAIAPEILRAPPRGRLLLFVVQPSGNRMMRIVNVRNHVGNGELQLVRP